MRLTRDLKTMERCRCCGGILNDPRYTGRYEERDAIRYLVTTKRVACPMCGTVRETEHWQRSSAAMMEAKP